MQPEGMGTAVPPDRQAAKSALMAPAIILAIVAALGILGAIAALVLPQTMLEILSRMPQQSEADLERAREALQSNRVGNAIFYVGMLVLSGVILFGSIQMIRLRTYGFALAAAILSLVPCVGPCCCLAIPFGIWTLVVLMKANVKAAFQ